MASSRLPNGLIDCLQVLDCIYTYGLFVALMCLAPMDFARQLLHMSTASKALSVRRFCRRRSDLFAIQLVASFEADFVQSGRTSQRRKSMSGTER
jgi:hypothetical protein